MHFYPYLLQTKFIQSIIGDTDSKNTQDIEKSNLNTKWMFGFFFLIQKMRIIFAWCHFST